MAYKFQIGSAILSGSVLAVDGLVSTDVDDATAANIVAEIDAGEIAASKVGAGTFDAGAYSFAGSTIANLGTVTTADINGGTIDGATIATSDVTVGASKTLDVSAGTLTTSAAQKLAIMQGAAANVDIGAYDLRAQTLTADGLTSGRLVFAGANGLLSDDSDLSFSGDTLTATKIGAFEAAGAIDFSDEAMTNVNIDSGAIDGAIIGANSAAAASFTTIGATSFSGSSFISGSNLVFSAAVQLADQTVIDSEGNFQGNNANFADLTASAADFSGVSVMKLDAIPTVAFASADFMLVRDAAGNTAQAITMANYAAEIAGNGLAASSGVLAVGVDDSSVELSGDALRIKASGVTNAMLAGSIVNAKLVNDSVSFGGVSLDLGASDATPAFDLQDATAYPGDSSLVIAGALNAGSITSGFGNIDNGSSTLDAGASTLASLTVSGNTTIAGNLTVTGTTVEVDAAFVVTSSIQFEGLTPDGNEISLTSADPSADRTITLPDLSGHIPLLAGAPSAADVTYAEFALLDGGTSRSAATIVDGDGFMFNDGGVMKHVLASSVKSYMSDVAMDVATPADGESFSIGMNVVADMGSDGTDTITLPASAASLIGKKIMIKAPSDCSAARSLLVNTQAVDQKIDGNLNSIRLESPHAAVTLVYVSENHWKVF